MRPRTAFICSVLALLVGAPSAGAHRSSGRDSGGVDTFDGSCQLTGTVRFAPPLTNTPQPARDYARERGTCSGTLTAHGRTSTLNNSPVRYRATDTGQLASCGANPDANGWGVLRFRQGRIAFKLSESRESGVAQLSLTGDGGGSAEGVATISQSTNLGQVAEECMGSGLRSTPVDISLQTTPEISG